MSDRKNATPATIAVDIVLCAAFFAVIFSIVKSHVQSSDPKLIALWGGLTASCMSVVFWMTIQMFRAVLRAQREANSRN